MCALKVLSVVEVTTVEMSTINSPISTWHVKGRRGRFARSNYSDIRAKYRDRHTYKPQIRVPIQTTFVSGTELTCCKIFIWLIFRYCHYCRNPSHKFAKLTIHLSRIEFLFTIYDDAFKILDLIKYTLMINRNRYQSNNTCFCMSPPTWNFHNVMSNVNFLPPDFRTW